jgi:3-dehydroquinate synthase
MQLQFTQPTVTSRVRFFESRRKFEAAVSRSGASIIWDRGAPFMRGQNVLRISGGERTKRWSGAGALLEFLAELRHERGCPLLVAGGGAVLDLGAFSASLYRRGVPLILAPTTLLAMIDAALGGKTAVDFAGKGGLLKNFAGTFYPAQEIWIFPGFLESLPKRERISGAGECWKTIWIAGIRGDQGALIDYVHTGKVQPGLLRLVKKCLAAKIAVVESDPLDTKRRREVLNFGHTAGHVLESAGNVSHGEAVLWGMAIETALLGRRAESMRAQVLAVIEAMDLRLPEMLRKVSEKKILSLLLADKKMKNGRLELSVVSQPGSIALLRVSPRTMAAAIKGFLGSFPSERRRRQG